MFPVSSKGRLTATSQLQLEADFVGRNPIIMVPPINRAVNPLNAELNSIRHSLELVGAHHILHVSRVRVNGSAFCCRSRVHLQRFKIPGEDRQSRLRRLSGFTPWFDD